MWRSDWTCDYCGGRQEKQRAVCANCGAGRPSKTEMEESEGRVKIIATEGSVISNVTITRAPARHPDPPPRTFWEERVAEAILAVLGGAIGIIIFFLVAWWVG